MSEAIPSTGGPVTVVVSRSVKPGREQEFEAWLAGTITALTQYPGYQGANIVRPDAHTNHEYVFIARWDCDENALAWEKSPQRAQRLASLDPLIEGETKIRRVSGLEFWFTPPAGATGEPPRWKMVIVTLAVLYPLSLLLGLLLLPQMGGVHPFLQQLIMMGILITLVTYWIMPVTIRVLSSWLFSVAAKP
jgi:uncharacterized protein